MSELGADPDDTQRRSKSFGMVMRDPAGAERFGLGITEEDAVVMGFDAAPGVGAPMRDRLALSVGADGAAAVMLIDNKTSVPVRLFTDAEGGGGLEFINYDVETNTFSIKRSSFNGVTEYQISNDD